MLTKIYGLKSPTFDDYISDLAGCVRVLYVGGGVMLYEEAIQAEKTGELVSMDGGFGSSDTRSWQIVVTMPSWFSNKRSGSHVRRSRLMNKHWRV